MPTGSHVVANTYRDSVALMQLSAALAAMAGVEQAAAVMATAGNLDLLRESKLLDGAVAAQPSDVLVIVRAKNDAQVQAVLDRAAASLATAPAAGTSTTTASDALAPRSLAMALARAPDANLALISVPGEYAAAEAHKALDAGLNVMLFSDNVSAADEITLKRKAHAKQLLVMGPDCGTAIIDGVPLAFANNVRRGAIGCIGASGTGLQQVTSLIDRLGAGVSQAIGTGGRDLSEAIGGATMLAALKRLGRDRATEVIVLIGKPPAPKVAAAVVRAAAKIAKPIVVCFIGAPADSLLPASIHRAATLDEAARAAVALLHKKRPASRTAPVRIAKRPRFTATQRYVRGLFSGGTFCYEASMLLGAALGRVWSNTPLADADALDDAWQSREHTCVDLGDDSFTRGRPHPMIDHRLRNERLVQEAGDPSVAVILLDVVLGHGAHADPAEAMRPAIEAAKAKAARTKRPIAFVASVCGTERDPQGLARQEAALAKMGVLLARSNADAARLAAALVRGSAR